GLGDRRRGGDRAPVRLSGPGRPACHVRQPARLLSDAGYFPDHHRRGGAGESGRRSVLWFPRPTHPHRRRAAMTAQELPQRASILTSIGDAVLDAWSSVRMLARNRVGLLGLIGLIGFFLLTF